MVKVFRHGVASGDPLADRVVLWTRVSADGEAPVPVTWRLARDPDLRTVIAEGSATAHSRRDWCVHADPAGLDAGTTYFYAFEALGERSPVGRTRTLPEAAERVRFAMVSCAKYNAGYFNAYARIAERELDFVLHLGDYIYEAAQNPPASQTPPADIGRVVDPLHECVSLQDYRTRYGHYRLDPDVQALHHAHPMVATVDCHEFADGAWRGGSVEHRDERDGPWAERLAAAWQARWEWLPARPPDPSDASRVWRSVPLADLAELFLIDTRSRRDEPAHGDAMWEPGRSQLGPEQRRWLLEGISSSPAQWTLIANSSVMAPIWDRRLQADALPALLRLKLIEPNGRGPDPDQWDGYPHEREEILRAVRGRDAVILSGDVHVGMAIELPLDPTRDEEPAVAELVTSSLTSQNVDDKMGWAPRTRSIALEEALMRDLPHVRWCDLDSHGYVVVEVSPERVRGEWWFVDTVLERSGGERLGSAWEVPRGAARLVPG